MLVCVNRSATIPPTRASATLMRISPAHLNDLKKEDCRLYFVERKGHVSILKPLELDAYGRVLQWPQKFFGDALGETAEQAKLMFEHQLRERKG